MLFFVIWMPVVNIIYILYCCYVINQEYEHECFRAENKLARQGSELCNTRYPLLLLHGIGFRDYKYVNYWGRIPKILIENGSRIYYGHNQAWGSIEKNAAEIKTKLFEIMAENDCEKVNIIAHSKGGLDARYLISSLGMSEHVASLTTLATPHRGSSLLDVLNKMPDKTYRKITNLIDKHFVKAGDTSPESYKASHQLLPSYLEKFNQENPDAEGVYYQSYASAMKSAGGDSLLGIPYFIMKWMGGDNDGMVSIDSAKWGEFKGVMISGKTRGVSHADWIDLKREDYNGFDIMEKYIEIVSELKQKGF